METSAIQKKILLDTKNALIEIILRRIYDQLNEIGTNSDLITEW